MKRFVSLFQQDLLLSQRNRVPLLTAALLLLMVAMVWLLPEDLGVAPTEVIYDASAGQELASYLRQTGSSDMLVQSREELEAALDEASAGVGVVFAGTVQEPQLTLLSAGNLAEENIKLMAASVESVVLELQGEPPLSEAVQVETLRPPSEPVALGPSLVPVAIVFEVALLGFMFGAVLVFQEKQTGANRALRVSPVTTLDYLGSKNLLFIVMSLIYGGLLLLATFGLDANYAPIFLLIILTSSLMTLVGLAIAVFFNNLSDWFFAGVGILVLNMVPVFSYGMPVFAPRWVTWIPSYPVLFGVRELLFPTGRTAFLAPLLLELLLLNAVAFLIAYFAVDRKLMKAG